MTFTRSNPEDATQRRAERGEETVSGLSRSTDAITNMTADLVGARRTAREPSARSLLCVLCVSASNFRNASQSQPANAPIARAIRALTIACLLAFTASPARADGAYAREKRVAHLASAIDGMTAMGDAGRRAFEVAIYDAVRAKCRPGNRAAPIACLIAAAREVCAGKVPPSSSGSAASASAAGASAAVSSAGDRCLAVADVIVTNQHAEKSILDEATRMRLVRESADYHLAVVDALEARWAVLAAELALAAPEGSMAARIDQVCRERDREVRPCSVAEGNGMTANSGGVPVCVGTIAYQRCAAGLVWFTTGPRSKL